MNAIVVLLIIIAFCVFNREKLADLSAKITNKDTVPDIEQYGSGGLTNACGNFSYLNEPDPSPSAFTNNWLTSRHSDKLFSERYGDFPLYDEPHKGDNIYANEDNSTYRDILKTIQERSPVSDIFFSHKNVNHIKVLLAKLIKERYNYNIDPQAQSDNELLIIMRSIYLQHAKNLPDQIMGQVSELNMKVIIEIVPKVHTNIQMELSYQRDQGSMPLPMARPVNISSAGTRSNRSVTELFV